MFNIEDSIQKWLNRFNKHRAFDDGTIREMELHLRDHIDDLIHEGYTEQYAFETAVSTFGEIADMAKEEFTNIKRKTTLRSLIYTHMFKSYYFTAIRNLIKHRTYFFINIIGLTIGIASFIFIALYISNELSYDRFHSNHENIYRIGNKAIIRSQPNIDATSAAPLAKVLLSDYPEVLNATSLLKAGQLLVSKEDQKFNEDGILYADNKFFEVFDFELIKGNPESALLHPATIVLSESYVKKYFGDEDPMGKNISIDEDSIFYEVTGVVRDVPANSHIHFDMLVSLSSTEYAKTNHWIGRSLHTYAVLNDGADIQEIEIRMREIFYKYMAPEIEYFTGLAISEWEGAGNSVNYMLTPINEIHLYSEAKNELEPTGNIGYIYIYGVVGIIILFIAIFNFVNLATAHSGSRSREVAIRKVMGSSRKSLIFQFLMESIVITLIATAIAILITILFMPSFIELIGKDIEFGILLSPIGVLSVIGFAIFTGGLGGIYPAFIISGFKPIDALKGKLTSGTSGEWVRNLLVTAQFSASIVIIIITLVIYYQIDFMLSKNLGFDKEQIIVLRRPDQLNRNLEVFKSELLKNASIKSIANSATIPGKNYEVRSYRKTGEAETYLFLNNQVAHKYMDLMGLELLSGRFFDRTFMNDSNAVVINETASKTFGFNDPVGQTLTSAFKKDRSLTVIGVVKDYHIESLHKSVQAMALELDQNVVNGYLSIKVNNSINIRETVSEIEKHWIKHTNNKPLDYFFFNQEYENLYVSEVRTGNILLIFSSMSVLIACLGLIGLITYTISKRKREIGIRKVLGAGTFNIVKILSGSIIALTGFATLIAWPLAYLGTKYWLAEFANRVNFNPWFYLISTLVVMFFVGIIIGYQTFITIRSNPVDSIKQE